MGTTIHPAELPDGGCHVTSWSPLLPCRFCCDGLAPSTVKTTLFLKLLLQYFVTEQGKQLIYP